MVIPPIYESKMSPSTSVVLLLVALNVVSAWPGMRPPKGADTEYIGPACTVGAHNWHPESGDCPNMEQPPAPAPYSGNVHTWPSQFVVDWKFYFVPDDSDVPPYTPLPKTDYNVTTGKSYYYNNEATGERNMKEVYDEYCIPVFGNPVSSMGKQNKYSCDFLNVGSTNISYVLLHEDRPRNAPECCIIGQPFHAPPQDFSASMPTKYTETVEGNVIDWNVIYDKDAGIFNYGFLSNTTGTPFAFYMKGVPWVANWMWQSFTNFQEVTPDASVWEIPSACSTAVACPGW